MTTRLFTGKIAAGIALLAAVGLATTACGSGSTPTQAGGSSMTAPSSGTSVIAPVIVDVSTLDRSTVDVTVGNSVDINAEDPTVWTGEVDSDIAEFTPGSDDGSAVFNPGVKALSTGTAKVTMTNSETGESLAFTLNIT